MICAESADQEEIGDTCQGDSGGPMVREVKHFFNSSFRVYSYGLSGFSYTAMPISYDLLDYE